MYWYLIPVCRLEETNSQGTAVRYVPGVGRNTSLMPASLEKFIGQAHYPKWAPTTMLVGLPAPVSKLPVGWNPKTLQEAKDHFEAICGRPPSDSEVF